MHSLTRRAAIEMVGFGLFSVPILAYASWPEKPIKIIVPFAPGGTTDIIARLAKPGLEKALGVNIVVENRSGASSSLGTAEVAKAAPDGNTMLVIADNFVANRAFLPLTFDSEKLAPVLLVGKVPYIIATRPDRPWKTVADIVAAAREKPGITYAVSGFGALGHLAMIRLGQEAGVAFTAVPYSGGTPALKDAIAGHVDLIVVSSAMVAPSMHAATLRGLVTLGTQRLADFPDVPTIGESGFPGLETENFWGVMAPSGTPEDVIKRFAAAFAESMRSQVARETLDTKMRIELVLDGPEAFRAFLGTQVKTWVPIALKIKNPK